MTEFEYMFNDLPVASEGDIPKIDIPGVTPSVESFELASGTVDCSPIIEKDKSLFMMQLDAISSNAYKTRYPLLSKEDIPGHMLTGVDDATLGLIPDYYEPMPDRTDASNSIKDSLHEMAEVAAIRSYLDNAIDEAVFSKGLIEPVNLTFSFSFDDEIPTLTKDDEEDLRKFYGLSPKEESTAHEPIAALSMIPALTNGFRS